MQKESNQDWMQFVYKNVSLNWKKFKRQRCYSATKIEPADAPTEKPTDAPTNAQVETTYVVERTYVVATTYVAPAEVTTVAALEEAATGFGFK